MNKYIKYLCAILGVSIVLSGCGQSSYKSEATEAAAAYATSEYEEDFYSDDVYEMKSYAEEAPAEESNASESITDENIAKAKSKRKLIRNINMSVQTKEFDALIAKLTDKIDALGGYAETMDVSGYEYNSSSTSVRSAYIVARIPAQNMDSFVSTIADNSNITSKNESMSDVTLEYTDVEAHRNSLRVEQQRLNELLENADSLETVIALEQRLAEVRYELESYESRLRDIDNRVDYSTIYLDISEVKDYTQLVTPDKTFGERVLSGFLEGCQGAVSGLGNFIVALVTILPGLFIFLVIVGLIVLIIVIIIKAIIKAANKSKMKKTSKKANNKVINDTTTNNAGDINGSK